ncbi:hypothetical protein [Brevundimonas denitrificans]|nr:hypothetical protein [Brevundimonas denitrificans]
MTRITRSGDCRNSPKNAFMQEVAIGLLTGAETLEASLAETVVLRRNGHADVTGAEAVRTLAADMFRDHHDVLIVHHAISHGKVGAANCVAVKGDARTAFAVVVEFATAKADRVAVIDLYGV